MNIIEELGIAPYQEGALVSNRFTGDSCMLTAEELAVYDFIMGAQVTLETEWDTMPEDQVYALRQSFHRGLNWFKSTNAKVYMALLD